MTRFADRRIRKPAGRSLPTISAHSRDDMVPTKTAREAVVRRMRAGLQNPGLLFEKTWKYRPVKARASSALTVECWH